MTPTAPYPLFPLPNVVMLPGTLKKLHFFEPRYLQMVDQALAADQRFVMSLMHPKDEVDYYLCPEFEAIGCLVEIVEHQGNPNGTIDAMVVGLERVSLDEVEAGDDRMYRMVEAKICPREIHPDARTWLMSLHEEISDKISDPQMSREMFENLQNRKVSPLQVMNFLTSISGASPETLQDILNEDEDFLQMAYINDWLGIDQTGLDPHEHGMWLDDEEIEELEAELALHDELSSLDTDEEYPFDDTSDDPFDSRQKDPEDPPF